MTLLMHGVLMFYACDVLCLRTDVLKRRANALERRFVDLDQLADALDQRADALERWLDVLGRQVDSNSVNTPQENAKFMGAARQCMIRSSNKDLTQSFKNIERVFRSSRKLSKTQSLDYLSSLEFNLISDPEDHFEEEEIETMTEPTMEEYMTKTRDGYGLEISRPKIDQKAPFELKGQFLKELRDNTFSGSDNEDANEHIEKVLEIVDLFHIPNITQDQVMLRVFPMSLIGAANRWMRNELVGSIKTWETLKEKIFEQEVILFYKVLDIPTRQILDSKGAIPSMKSADAKKAIQDMADHSQKWHNGTSTRCRSTETSDGLAAIHAQLNNLGRKIKKVNEKAYAAQVGCELCKGPHYTKDCPLKEEGKILEEAYYTQFVVPFQQGGQYRVAAPRFYQRNNGNPSYQERRQTMEESLSKVMAESAKRHEENSNLIKEIRASTDAAIKNQRASIKPLEIQIGQISKGLQERGSRNLPSSTETNPRDHVKSISTTVKADTFLIRRIRPNQYAVSAPKNSKLFFEPRQATIPFPSRLYDDCYDEEEESYRLKDLDAYSIGTTLLDDALPPKEKDTGSFTLPYFVVVEDMDSYRDEGIGDIIVGKPFCRDACIKARRFDGMITIYKRNDSATYQMVRTHPRFKHLTNAQCNKMRPLLKVSSQDELNAISHPCQKMKGFYKEVLNLGSEYIKNEKVFSTWMTFGGNTCDLGSFGEETDEIRDLHQIIGEVLFTGRGDGVAGIKRLRRDPSSDDVRDLATASGRDRLNEDLESSM
ncbi:hypothetical protein Tco_1508672 [Tanacetum coccineum]